VQHKDALSAEANEHSIALAQLKSKIKVSC